MNWLDVLSEEDCKTIMHAEQLRLGRPLSAGEARRALEAAAHERRKRTGAMPSSPQPVR